MSTKSRYVYSEVIQSCYRIHGRNTLLNYADYDIECDMEGAELMRIDSEEKQHLIVTYLGCESISEERFLKLEKIVENQNLRISDMENTIQEQEVHIKRLNERLKYMAIKLKNNKIECKKPDWWTRKRLLVQPTVMQSSKIGFYAYMSQNEDSPSKHHTIIFDVQKTNVGNGYNPFSGLFTAPQDGLYAFSTSITMLNHYASFDVVKNADVQGSVFVDAGGVSEHRSSSTTVVLALVQGDVVFVRTSATYVPHGNIHSSKDGRSSFTGWLIQ
ncbi:unnamed protein product [Mytilus coruscus]|uniref:C1q domain-containing protein n=1 Tax=Mytilus coruscus TaxID=42192 RepID=A0A6J8ESC1_MYTCO|nr:unnamed protein product [Mytilus coruscus]